MVYAAAAKISGSICAIKVVTRILAPLITTASKSQISNGTLSAAVDASVPLRKHWKPPTYASASF